MMKESSTPNFMNDKFTPAKLPEIYVTRRELMNTFHRAVKHRYVYVSAPAGSGKTVSALLWLNAGVRKSVWIGLDAYDNTPSVFYKLLATGIYSTQPDNENIRNILTSPGFSASPVEHIVSILSELLPSEELYTLVIDDMHLITDEEIRKSLPVVLKRLPLSFAVLLLSRGELPDELKELIDEKASLITSRELMFTEDEIRQYFKSLGRFISPEESQFTHMITGGSPISVNVIAKSGDIELGRTDYVFETYIKEYLWNKWDEGLKQFMLKTCVADELLPDLATRLSGQHDSVEILKELCAQNSFISLTGGAYHYHHLFLSFLRGIAEEIGIDLVALNRIIAEYYMDRGDYLTSRRYAIKSGHADVIMRMIYEFTQYTNPSLDEYVKFSNVFNQDALPEEICEANPFLYASHMYVSYLCGNAKATEYYLDKLYHHLPVIAKDFPQFMEMIVLEISLDHRIPFSKLIERFSALPPISVTNEKQQGASITAQLPFLHRSSRDYYELTDQTLLKSLSFTFGLLLKDGYEMIMAGVYSGLYLEQNRINEALEMAVKANELMNENISAELQYSLMLHLAAAHYAASDKEGHEQALESARRCIEDSGQHYLIPNLKAYETKIKLCDLDKQAAARWLENYFVTETEHLELYKIFQHFTTARAYMVLNKPDKAMEYLIKLKQLGTDFCRPLDVAEAGVLQATLKWALGKREEAAATLEEVLTVIKLYGFIRVIADEGAAVMPILKRIASKVEKDDYTGRLTREYVIEVMLAAYSFSKTHKGAAGAIIKNKKPVKLSAQQKYVLELLVKGHRNTAIAKMTGLAVSTVKNHTSILYKKLEVNNAMDAVLKAREWGIIE